MRKIIIIIISVFFLVQCKTGQNDTVDTVNLIIEKSNGLQFPKPLGYVSDFDKTLSNEEIKLLNNILSEYKEKSTNEIVIVSISENLTEDNFMQYALDLSNNWGVGTAKKNNGLTIIYSADLKMIRICTGIGTEKILTDKICEKVLNEKIRSEFKKDDYYAGLRNGVIEFIKLWYDKTIHFQMSEH